METPKYRKSQVRKTYKGGCAGTARRQDEESMMSFESKEFFQEKTASVKYRREHKKVMNRNVQDQ